MLGYIFVMITWWATHHYLCIHVQYIDVLQVSWSVVPFFVLSFWYYMQDEKELLENNCCPMHLKPCVRRKEDNYFFALSKYQKTLEDYLTSNPDFVKPLFRLNEVRVQMCSRLWCIMNLLMEIEQTTIVDTIGSQSWDPRCALECSIIGFIFISSQIQILFLFDFLIAWVLRLSTHQECTVFIRYVYDFATWSLPFSLAIYSLSWNFVTNSA